MVIEYFKNKSYPWNTLKVFRVSGWEDGWVFTLCIIFLLSWSWLSIVLLHFWDFTGRAAIVLCFREQGYFTPLWSSIWNELLNISKIMRGAYVMQPISCFFFANIGNLITHSFLLGIYYKIQRCWEYKHEISFLLE